MTRVSGAAAILMLMFSGSVSAESWVQLAKGTTGVVDFYDADSLARNGSNAKIWVLSDHSNDATVPYTRAKRLYLVRCTESTAALGAYLSYGKDGTVLENETVPTNELSFQNVSPGSLGAKIATAACTTDKSVPAVATAPASPRAQTGSGLASRSDPTPSSGQTAPVTSFGVPLWRGLILGMDANAVALLLQTLPEIKQAKVRLKKGKPPEIKIDYNPAGIALFGFRMNLGFDFGATGLRQVSLVSEPVCRDAAFPTRLGNLGEGLAEKYPRKITVVKADGSPSETELAVTDERTLVNVGVRAVTPPSEYAVARADVDYELAKAEKSFSAMSVGMAALQLKFARQNALRACPATDGIMAGVTLVYSSYAESVAHQDSSRARQNEQNRKDREKL